MGSARKKSRSANQNRGVADAMFITPRKPQANMHPTSVYGSAPSLVGPTDILIYSQLLETSKTFVMNATKAHLLPTLLMCSSDIDTNRGTTRLLIDNWIEVHIAGGGKVGEKILYLSQRLRQCLASSIAARLATCNTSFQLHGAPAHVSGPQDDLPEMLGQLRSEVQSGAAPHVSEAELAARLADIIETQVKYHVRTPTKGTALWQLLHPKARGKPSSAATMRIAQQDAASVVLPDGTLDMAKLESLKGGTRVCPGLRFGSLYDGPIVGGGFSSALAHHCKCSKCGKDMLVTMDELITHEEACEGTLVAPDEQVKIEAELAERGARERKEDAISRRDAREAIEAEQSSSFQAGAFHPEEGASLAEACEANGELPEDEGAGGVEGLLKWGAEGLKDACAALGLKAGGTPRERAERLLKTRGLERGEWDKRILAPQSAAHGKRRRDEEEDPEAAT
ncbi:hypothetical protein T484DRAFT_1773739 [Baffinella frigidus]|nr:hypothetical protein T484DRAFT_1773739 [Cryptophyta sp. CCMP2293]